MAKMNVGQIANWQGGGSLWDEPYIECLMAAAELCRLKIVGCHLGVGPDPFTEDEMRQAHGYVCVFAPLLDVGFVVAGHDLGRTWTGRSKRGFGVYVSLPITGRLERVQIVKDAQTAIAVGARWLAEATVSLEEVTRAMR